MQAFLELRTLMEQPDVRVRRAKLEQWLGDWVQSLDTTVLTTLKNEELMAPRALAALTSRVAEMLIPSGAAQILTEETTVGRKRTIQLFAIRHRLRAG